MKSIVDHPKRLGFLVIVLSVTFLGQVPASGQANRGLAAATVAASPTQPLAPSSNKLGDDNFVIGNDDVLATGSVCAGNLEIQPQVLDRLRHAAK